MAAYPKNWPTAEVGSSDTVRAMRRNALKTPCVITPLARNKDGYGRSHGVLAHRRALEQKLGRPIKSGYHALHYCDNPPCINPDHLWEGTHAENVADSVAKGRHKIPDPRRTVCVRGHDLTKPENRRYFSNGKSRCLLCLIELGHVRG